MVLSSLCTLIHSLFVTVVHKACGPYVVLTCVSSMLCLGGSAIVIFSLDGAPHLLAIWFEPVVLYDGPPPLLANLFVLVVLHMQHNDQPTSHKKGLSHKASVCYMHGAHKK